jgi:Spy/CpxP family protein refolding chaperone
MKAPLAPTAGHRQSIPCGSAPASLCLVLLALLSPLARPQTDANPAALDISGCCNLTDQAIDPLGPDGPWWNDRDYIGAAHITLEQRQHLDALYASHVAALHDLQLRYVQEMATLKTMLAASAGEAAVDAQIARIEQARTAAAKAAAAGKLAIRRKFSPDQWKQVQKLQQKKSR